MPDAQLKSLPIGVDEFTILRHDRFAYVDKTQFIKVLEEEVPKLLITRPSGFGKTLFASTLSAYYDRHHAADFETLFAGTYIADHKTPLANQLAVLRLHPVSSGTPEALLHNIRQDLEDFFVRYPHPKQRNVLNFPTDNAADLIAHFFAIVHVSYNKQLCVIVDACVPSHQAPASNREAHRVSATLRDFYADLKIAACDGPIARLFVFSALPSESAAATIGQLSAKDLTTRPQTAALFGLTKTELLSLIPQVVDLGSTAVSAEAVTEAVATHCPAFRFSRYSNETVFNTADCLTFLSRFTGSPITL